MNFNFPVSFQYDLDFFFYLKIMFQKLKESERHDCKRYALQPFEKRKEGIPLKHLPWNGGY